MTTKPRTPRTAEQKREANREAKARWYSNPENRAKEIERTGPKRYAARKAARAAAEQIVADRKARDAAKARERRAARKAS